MSNPNFAIGPLRPVRGARPVVLSSSPDKADAALQASPDWYEKWPTAFPHCRIHFFVIALGAVSFFLTP